MKDRINGSHLKRAHQIDILEYQRLYPEADLGTYRVNDFECKECGEVIKGSSENVWKHIHYKHGYKDIHEYNHVYEKKLCKCGCGKYTLYSNARKMFNDYIKGHYVVWNKDMTKNTHPGVKKISDSNKGKKLSPDHKRQLLELIKRLSNDPEHKKFKYEKTKEAILKKYGVENPFSLDFVKNKIKKTNLKKYGVENVMQNPNIQEKSFKNAKKYDYYVDDIGNKFRMQGYEIYALQYLFELYGKENLVLERKNVPIINYKFKKIKRKYFPDFFVPLHNVIIEIKSTFTYKKDLKKNIEKFKACTKEGYSLLLLVLDSKKKIVKQKIYEPIKTK